MENNPLVSIIIPTYNRAKKLTERGIPSVLSQTYQNFEIVIVGDACTDDTDQRINNINDNRIIFLNLPRRTRYPEIPELRRMVAGSGPMNIGLHLSQGEWISQLDDDDEFTPNHIEDLLNFAIEGNYDFVYGKVWMEHVVEGNWHELGSWPLSGGQISSISVLHKEKLKLIEYDEHVHEKGECGDWDRWSRIQDSGCKIGFLDKIVGKHYLEGAYRGYTICT